MALQSGATPLALISRIGESVTARVITRTTPTNSFEVSSANTDTAVDMYLGRFNKRQVDGVTVLEKDRIGYIAAENIPSNLDEKSKIIANSISYDILDIDERRAGGDIIYLWLHLRS